MKTGLRILSVLFLCLCAGTARAIESSPNISNIQITDCEGNFQTNTLFVSTGRPTIRAQVINSTNGLAFGLVPPVSGGVSQNVLVLHLDGGSFNDSSAHNQTVGNINTTNGAPPGAPSLTTFGGNADGARTFGPAQGIQVSSSSSMNVKNTFTMSAWIFPTTLANAAPIMEWNANPNAGVNFWVGTPGTTNESLLYATIISSALNRSTTFQTSLGVVKINEWQHVALTYNNDIARIYHNGIHLASSVVGAFAPLATTTTFYIGIRPSGTDAGSFIGRMDDILLSTAVYNANQIGNLYHSGYFENRQGTTSVRQLLSTGTFSHYGQGDPVTVLDPAQGRLSITTVTFSTSNPTSQIVDFTPGPTNQVAFSIRDVRGTASKFGTGLIDFISSPPTIPGTLTGTAQETYQIAWNWIKPNRMCLKAGPTFLPGDYTVRQSSDNAVVTSGASLPAGFTETSLSTNTLYGRTVQGVDAFGTGPLTLATSIYTLAAVPTSPVKSAVSTGSAVVTWLPNGNPAYTRYEFSYDADGGGAIVTSTPVVQSNNYLSSAYAFANLPVANATYTFRVRAINGRSEDNFGGVVSATSTLTIPLFPSAPASLSATIDSPTQVTFNWPAVVTAQSYDLVNDDTDAAITNTGKLTHTVTGLSVNTRLAVKLRANSTSGSGLFSTVLAVFSQANAPTTTVQTFTSTSTVSLAWNENGNPSGTNYQTFKATDTGFGGQVESITTGVNKVSFTNLLPGSTYYFRVRALSLGSTPSAFDTTVKIITDTSNAVTQSNTPNSPYTSVPGLAGLYHFDESSGTVVLDSSTFANHGVLTCNFVNCSTPTYVSGLTGLGSAVRFTGIQNTYCEIPNNASLNDTASALALEAWINLSTTLQTSSATILAKGGGTDGAYGLELINGKANFFIRDSAGAPDMHFVTSTQTLPANRWTNIVGVYTPAGPALDIYIDGTLSATKAFALGGGARHSNTGKLSIGNGKSGATDYNLGFQGSVDEVHVLFAALDASSVTANYKSGLVSTVTLPSPNDGIRLGIPPDAFGGPAVISVSSDPVNNPIRANPQTVRDGIASPPASLHLIPGSVVEIIASKSGTVIPGDFIFSSSVAITITYPDADSNTLVDGTNPPVAAAGLALYTLNTFTGNWTALPSFVDQSQKTVTGLTEHFSVFALFGSSSIQLNTTAVKIYPIPWRPNGGGRFDSVTYQGKTGLAFGNLTTDGSITVLTLSGERVNTMEYSGVNQGTFIWDGTNASGLQIASGIYFAYIRPKEGANVLLKFAVEK